jgi:hypothetical protein
LKPFGLKNQLPRQRGIWGCPIAEHGFWSKINNVSQHPAVTGVQGGQHGGGTVLTAVGEQIILIYHSVEDLTLTSARRELGAIAGLGRD